MTYPKTLAELFEKVTGVKGSWYMQGWAEIRSVFVRGYMSALINEHHLKPRLYTYWLKPDKTLLRLPAGKKPRCKAEFLELHAD